MTLHSLVEWAIAFGALLLARKKLLDRALWPFVGALFVEAATVTVTAGDGAWALGAVGLVFACGMGGNAVVWLRLRRPRALDALAGKDRRP